MWRRLKRRKVLWFSAATLAAIILLALFAPWIAPYDPQDVDPMIRLQSPSGSHLFGTDRYGRDVLSRVVFGARLSMEIGLSVTAFTFVFGTLIGLVAGYFPWADRVLMRIVDAAMALPSLMLALALVSIAGAGLQNVIIALGITFAPRLARVARATVLSLRERTYVEAAKALGVGHLRILALHIFPNALSPILVQLTLTFASALLAEASLSFLGVGVPPYVPSWGSIIANGRAHMVRAPWLLLFPGIAIVLSVLSLNMMGDALRDVADPHIRKP